MAYITYYIVKYSNHLNETVLIHINRKDGNPSFPVEYLTATEFKENVEAEGDGLYSAICRSNIELEVNLTDTDTVTWETFFDQQHDEWQVLAWNDTMAIFSGYMLPDEGIVPFEDKPYDLTIRAADGLGLLKNVSLKKPDETEFKGKFSLIEYIAACLYWTGLQLPIKIVCDIFEDSMLDRGSGTENDMFAQAKLDHRTYKKDAVEFVDCFTALEIIFSEHFRIFQDYDKVTDQQVWHIDRIPQYQYTPAPIVYYTIYDYDGTNPVGYEDPENYVEVGKIHMIYKTNQVDKSGKFAIKKTRSTFKYIVWPELPLNNKFERGALIPLLSGPNYTSFTIDDWSYGAYRNQPTINSNLPAVPVTTAKAYRKSTFNLFGIEILREVIMDGVPATGSPASFGILMSDAIPVNAGDLIKISFEYKASYSATGPGTVAMLFVKTAAGIKHFVEGTIGVETAPLHWKIDFGNTFVRNMWSTGTNINTYSTINIEFPSIPVDGDFYIAIMAPGNTGTIFYMKSFNVEYTPMVAGGYIPVKGDYWETSQVLNFIDVTDNDVTISDSLPRAIKGCILRPDGVTATTPSWYRYGLSEARHYKELLNIGRYNTEYRRFYKFQGTFTSTKFAPQNDPSNSQPLSFRKTYKFMDRAGQPECVLVAPLSIDYKTGHITATFEEVRRESETPISETISDFILRVIAAINSTTEAEWDSAAGAPASGTIAFPPIAVLSVNPRTINISINETDNMTASASDGGAGNSPSVADIYNNDVGSYRLIQFQFGTDIAVGNIFTFSAYGHDVNVTVLAVGSASSDGRQSGDSSIFNYLFE